MTIPDRLPPEATPAPPPRDEGGFSLVEIAVAAGVMVIGLMSLAMAMVLGMRVSRASGERKIALNFITAQLERIRSMDYADLFEDPPDGYEVPSGWSSADDVGFVKDTDGDGTNDIVVRYFYADQTKAAYTTGGTTVPLADSLLTGLSNQDGETATAYVWFQNASGTEGMEAGDGYWVTIRVYWKGVSGPSEMKISTFVTNR
jgi:Tfp pilus assembly protein PilV